MFRVYLAYLAGGQPVRGAGAPNPRKTGVRAHNPRTERALVPVSGNAPGFTNGGNVVSVDSPHPIHTASASRYAPGLGADGGAEGTQGGRPVVLRVGQHQLAERVPVEQPGRHRLPGL